MPNRLDPTPRHAGEPQSVEGARRGGATLPRAAKRLLPAAGFVAPNATRGRMPGSSSTDPRQSPESSECCTCDRRLLRRYLRNRKRRSGRQSSHDRRLPGTAEGPLTREGALHVPENKQREHCHQHRYGERGPPCCAEQSTGPTARAHPLCMSPRLSPRSFAPGPGPACPARASAASRLPENPTFTTYGPRRRPTPHRRQGQVCRAPAAGECSSPCRP
jgi:hypothetical protein